jgi:hypothetical protein
MSVDSYQRYDDDAIKLLKLFFMSFYYQKVIQNHWDKIYFILVDNCQSARVFYRKNGLCGMILRRVRFGEK